MRFTVQEFQTMVQEVLYEHPVSFAMLCHMAEKTLRSTVVNRCQMEDCLRGRGFEEDIMQEIYARLIQRVVGYFLLRDGVDKPYNNDPEGFEDWMFRVAENLICDFANTVRNRDHKTEDIEGGGAEDISAPSPEEQEEHIERLQTALAIALSSDSSVYKVLTWLAHFVFMLDEDISKIQSNDRILATFENKTMYDMYTTLLTASKRIPWMVITKKQHDRLLAALQKKRADGVTYGETAYKELFMKYQGQVSGKKSVSDWTNRINGVIRRELKKRNKLPTAKRKNKKRRGADETSGD